MMSMLHFSKMAMRVPTRTEIRGGGCCWFSARTNDSNNYTSKSPAVVVQFHPVYVNNLSKLVLEHLQISKRDWLVRKGLDRGLKINDDGTFVLRFPLNEFGREAGRIWTSIDPSSKQHHLSVFRGSLIARYGLKEPGALITKVRANPEVTKHRVKTIVDDMVKTLDDIDSRTCLDVTTSTFKR